MSFTKNQSFCVAPWLHYYRSPTGEHRLCCLSDQLKSDNSLKSYDEIKNSKDLIEIRKGMMEGKLPSICHRCINLNNNRVYKDDLNAEFVHHFEDIEKNTQRDGTTTVNPVSLDYRFLNCNLTCLTCNPEFSSKWTTHEKLKPELPKYKLYDRQFILKEYREILKSYNWEKIYFAGGEPLLQSDHLSHLQILLNKDKEIANGINIFYNTNINRNEEFISEWVQSLNQFKRATIYVSIDSKGRYNDLIRIGSQFSKIEKNLDYLIQNVGPNIQIVIDLTITSIFFFNIIEFSKWVLEKNLNLNARIMYGEGFLGKFMRIEMLKKEFRVEMFELFEKWYQQRNIKEQDILKNLYDVLKEFHDLPEFIESDKKLGLKDLNLLPFQEPQKEIREIISSFI